MRVKLAKVRGQLVTEGGRPLVLPFDAVLEDGLVVVSDDGETRVELLADELVDVDSSDWPPERFAYAFDVEHTVDDRGRPSLAPAGRAAALRAIADDDEREHTREVWETLIELAGLELDKDPDSYRRKGQLVTAAKASVGGAIG